MRQDDRPYSLLDILSIHSLLEFRFSPFFTGHSSPFILLILFPSHTMTTSLYLYLYFQISVVGGRRGSSLGMGSRPLSSLMVPSSSSSPSRRGSAAIEALLHHSNTNSTRTSSPSHPQYDQSADQHKDKGSNGIVKGSTVQHQQHLQQQQQQQRYYQQQKQQQLTISMATIEYMTAQQAAKKSKSVKIAEDAARSAQIDGRSNPPSVVEGEDDGDHSVGGASMSTLTSVPTVMSSATYL